MSYRGPDDRRVFDQWSAIQHWQAETATWRQWVSASSGSGSAYLAGSGMVQHYREQMISGLFAMPRAWEGRFRAMQLPGGVEQAGHVLLSTFQPLGSQDQILWRGVTFRVEGDATPVRLGERVWYRAVLNRGEEAE
jgi:hypothetical protein